MQVFFAFFPFNTSFLILWLFTIHLLAAVHVKVIKNMCKLVVFAKWNVISQVNGDFEIFEKTFENFLKRKEIETKRFVSSGVLHHNQTIFPYFDA